MPLWAVLLGLGVQTAVLLVTVVGMYRKQAAIEQKREIARAERMTKVEQKVEDLYRFWEATMERRSQRDRQRWLEAHGSGS